MQKIDAGSAEAQSADLVAEHIRQLKALFPELITEGKDGVAVNVDVLKALVGDNSVTDADEKYGLNWHGKRRARQLALNPSTGTLLVCLAESIAGADVEALALGMIAWHKELASAVDTTCVFRDSAFADDVAKTNLAAILAQHGIQNVRSL